MNDEGVQFVDLLDRYVRDACGGIKAHAAKSLGVSEKSLGRWLTDGFKRAPSRKNLTLIAERAGEHPVGVAAQGILDGEVKYDGSFVIIGGILAKPGQTMAKITNIDDAYRELGKLASVRERRRLIDAQTVDGDLIKTVYRHAALQLQMQHFPLTALDRALEFDQRHQTLTWAAAADLLFAFATACYFVEYMNDVRHQMRKESWCSVPVHPMASFALNTRTPLTWTSYLFATDEHQGGWKPKWSRVREVVSECENNNYSSLAELLHWLRRISRCDSTQTAVEDTALVAASAATAACRATFAAMEAASTIAALRDRQEEWVTNLAETIGAHLSLVHIERASEMMHEIAQLPEDREHDGVLFGSRVNLLTEWNATYRTLSVDLGALVTVPLRGKRAWAYVSPSGSMCVQTEAGSQREGTLVHHHQWQNATHDVPTSFVNFYPTVATVENHPPSLENLPTFLNE